MFFLHFEWQLPVCVGLQSALVRFLKHEPMNNFTEMLWCNNKMTQNVPWKWVTIGMKHISTILQLNSLTDKVVRMLSRNIVNYPSNISWCYCHIITKNVQYVNQLRGTFYYILASYYIILFIACIITLQLLWSHTERCLALKKTWQT